MKIRWLTADCPPGIQLLRQTACWHHFLGKGFKHFISHCKHLNYIITPYKNLLESFVILSHHHLDCTSPGCSPLAINWSFIARSAKGFLGYPWPRRASASNCPWGNQSFKGYKMPAFPRVSCPVLFSWWAIGNGWLVSLKFLRRQSCCL